MTTLALLTSMTDNDRSNTSKTFNAIMTFFMFALLVLALYLAIRDMSLQMHTSTKVWVFLLAALEPTLYCVLHGISTSLSGNSFFQSSPIVGTPTMTPLGGSLDMSTVGAGSVPSVPNPSSLASSLMSSPF